MRYIGFSKLQLTQTLNFMLLILIFLFPLQLEFGRFIFNGHKFLSYVDVYAAFFAMLVLVYFIYKYLVKDDKIHVPVSWLFFTAFLFIAFISVFFPFSRQFFLKGMIQLFGMFIMFTIGCYTLDALFDNPEFFNKIIFVIKITLLLLSVVGIAQFLFFNFINHNSLFNFSFLSKIAHGKVWDVGVYGNIGGKESIYRANAYVIEPAVFAAYLIFGVNWSFMRLGLFGKHIANKISVYVSFWWAIAIILALVFSMSVVVYFVLLLNLLFLSLVLRRIKTFFIIFSFLIILFSMLLVLHAAGAFSAGFLSSGISYFLRKITLITEFFSFALTSGHVKLYAQYDHVLFFLKDVSVMVLASNAHVMLEVIKRWPIFGVGVGKNVIAYMKFCPKYMYDAGLFFLNANDSCSLFLRLLIETGILGVILYLYWVCMLVITAFKKLNRYLCGSLEDTPYVYLLVGIFMSAISLVLYSLIRDGHYYNLGYWIMLSLLAAIPTLLRKKID